MKKEENLKEETKKCEECLSQIPKKPRDVLSVDSLVRIKISKLHLNNLIINNI